MTASTTQLLGLVLGVGWGLGLASPAAVSAAAANRVLGIDVAAVGSTRSVQIRTERDPTFTVFRLADPMRVVVDISGGDVSAIDGPVVVEDGIVGQIALRQFNANGFLIGRVLVGFEADDFSYDVQAKGTAVVIQTGPRGDVVGPVMSAPAAPADDAEGERLDASRQAARQATERALAERRAAERATSRAREEQQRAQQLAEQARGLFDAAAQAKAEAVKLQAQTAATRKEATERVQQAEARLQQAQQARSDAEEKLSQAEQARSEAAALRQQAEEALARSRRQAEAVAADAEERMKHAEQLARQAEADRATAEEGRKAMETRQAQSADEHKRRLAELEAKIALLAKEQRAASSAHALAVAEKQKALALDAELKAARAAAEQARRDAAAKLASAEGRERKARAALGEAARARARVAEERQQLAAELEALESKQGQVDEQLATLAKERAQLAALRQQVEAAKLAAGRPPAGAQKRLRAEQEALERQQRALSEQQAQLAQQQQKITRELAELKAERRRVAALRRDLRQAKQQRATEQQQELAAKRRGLEQQQGELEQQQEKMAREQVRLQQERQRLVALRQAVAQEEAGKRPATLGPGQPSGPAGKQAAADADGPPSSPVTVEELVEPAARRRQRPAIASSSAVGRVGPGHRLVAVRRLGVGEQAKVLLVLDGDPGSLEYEVERVEDPPRLVVDLRGTVRATRRATYGVRSPHVRRVRLGEHPNALRAVLDLSGEAQNAPHAVSRAAEGLLVAFSPTSAPQTPQGRPVAEASEAPGQAAAPMASRKGELSDVRFEKVGDGARIILLAGPGVAARVDDRSDKAWVLKLTGARVATELERSLDVSAYGTAVRLVSSYQVSSEPPVAHVVASLNRAATFELRRDGGRIVWEIRTAPEPAAVAVKSAAAPQTAGYAAEATALAKSIPAQRRSSTKRISIDLKDADIVNVIRLLSEVSGENIITSDEVSGKVSLKLRNVPWDEALNTILKTKGYDKVRQHNILRIAPANQIQAEREAELARRRAKEQVEETMTKLLPVNYAVAGEIRTQVEPMLTGRGSVKDDPRTNTLIINDVESNIARLVELARRLDRQTPQVLIEARIVEAQSNWLEELGIQWGGVGQKTQRQGNPTGLVFPGDVAISGAADDPTRNREAGVRTPTRYAVNLPAPIGDGMGGGIGFAFGSVGAAQLLNLRLTAMEENGTGRIISSPRVTTLDNVTARITQGVDIPISVVSAAGTNTRFQSAALELEVTPHVTNDGSVMMEVKTSKNEPDFARVGGAGDPTILKKSAETQVLVRDGDTTVIGGIYTRTTSETYAEVPFFGKLPILGWLFKKRRQEDKRAELLVFITPRIVNREQALGGVGSGS